MEKNDINTLIDDIYYAFDNADFSSLLTYIGVNCIDKTISDIESHIDDVPYKTS